MIGWYVHDHGSGHRRRLEAVAPHLGVPVTGMGSGPAAAGVDWLPLPPDATGDPAEGDRADATAGGALHWAPLGSDGMRGRAEVLARWVRESGCRLLVVDVSAEMLLLGRLLGLPTVAVLQPGVRTDRAHLLGYDTAGTLLAPWPAEAASRPLLPRGLLGLRPASSPADGSDGARRRASRTHHTGAFAPADPSARTPVDCDHPGRCVALVLGRGGHGITAADVSAAAAATPGWRWHVAGELVPSDATRSAAGVVEHGTLPDVSALLAHADVVAGPSGGGLVAEVAAAGRPFLALPQPRPFDEQTELAAMLRRLGCATVRTSWPAPREWAGLLGRVHARRDGAAERWARWADGAGAARAARVVEDALVRAVTLSGTGTTEGPRALEPSA